MTSSPANLVVALASVALLCLGLLLTVLTLDFIGSTETATGRVESVGRQYQDGTKHVNAVFSFVDKGNVRHTVRFGDIGTPLVRWFSLKDTTEILYSAEDPEGSARINVFPILWFWPGVCYAGALGSFGLLLILRRRNAPAQLQVKATPAKPRPKT